MGKVTAQALRVLNTGLFGQFTRRFIPATKGVHCSVCHPEELCDFFKCSPAPSCCMIP
jgi:hypothetical protein